MEQSKCAHFAFFHSNGLNAQSLLAFSFSNETVDLPEMHSSKGYFGYLAYDLKNMLHGLRSENDDELQWPESEFFLPELFVRFQTNSIEIIGDNILFENYVRPFLDCKENAETYTNKDLLAIPLKPSMSKQMYMQRCRKIKSELQNGNAYELNFCQNFKAVSTLNPISFAQRLFSSSSAPFSGILKMNHKWIISASPERFLKKEGDKLTSQPIKGTAKRGSSIKEDQKIKNDLLSDDKERSENVMIVDLVRNDLSKIAKLNSVKVDELCGLYTFNDVHQLISTVSCEIREGLDFLTILKATFPMGSMTGAPKYNVMRLIEKFENFKRGPYSGSIGYVLPNGDFDFNVSIRSLFYDENTKEISVPVGGAITIESDPEKEYKECLIKLNTITKLFNDQ